MKTYILNLDKPREVRFGFKATRDIRNKFGERSMASLLRIQWDEIPALVWAGLRWEDKNLTVPQVEDLLDNSIPKNHTIMSVTGITLGALAAHMGIEIKKEKADDMIKELKEVIESKDLKEVVEEVVIKAKEQKEKKKATETIPSTKTRKKPLSK